MSIKNRTQNTGRLFLFTLIILYLQIFIPELHSQNLGNNLLSVQLDSLRGVLNVRTKPESAKVFINNNFRGVTPLQLKLPEANYVLTLQKENFLQRIDSIKIIKNKILSIDESLLKVPHIKIQSIPSAAEIYLDSIFVGRTPIDSLPISPGDHLIKFKLDEYKDFSTLISIYPGIDKTITQTLLPNFGFVSYSVTPSDVQIKFDNKISYLGKIDKLKLKVGWHDVSISHPISKNVIEKKFYVAPFEYDEYSASFNKFTWKHLTYSAFIPGLGQYMDNSRTKGTLEFLLAAGAVYFVFDSQKKVDEKELDFNKAKYKYDMSNNAIQAINDRIELEKATSDYNTAKNNVTISFITLGAVYVLNLIDTYLFHSIHNEITLDNSIELQPMKVKIFENESNIEFGVNFHL